MFDQSTTHLAKLMANNGSWTSSVSRCCAMMDCIFIRLLLVACCSVTASVGISSLLLRRDCTDSRNRVYKLFLSASEAGVRNGLNKRLVVISKQLMM